MLRFNTFRAQRYLRSKFVEGKYLLASEGTDLQLEIVDLLRATVQATLGPEVALKDAWKVERLSATTILIKPGDAWVRGLPFAMRTGKDQLVSGAILSIGTVPVGISVSDEPNGGGKIITFNDGASTPTNNYRLIVSAKEELLTDVDDPFLKNVNLTESTAQKIRLNFQLNMVPASLQTESPVPYRDETSTALVATDFPNVGGLASPNFVNRINVTPTAAMNGEFISLTLVTGSEGIDGRDVEIVVRNDGTIGGGQLFPNSPVGQSAFSNGTLIDSNGNKYHINAIFNDTVSTQLVIRIDKEPDQPNPEIINTKTYSLIKRDVFVTDDVNGSPQGKLYWSIADISFDTTDGLVHESSVTDLRKKLDELQYFQNIVNQKFDLQLVDGGNVSYDNATSMLTWSANARLINPYGAVQTIAAGSIAVVDGGAAHYALNLAGGAIEKGTLAVSVTSFGATSSLSAVSLSTVQIGNIVVDSAGVVAEITAIDDVNDTITTTPALTANGAAVIYKDSYGPGKAPLSERSYVLATRSGAKVYVGGTLELEDGETSQIGDGISAELLTFIGSTGETDNAPDYANENYISDGDSLVTAISSLDLALFTLSGTVSAINWKAPVANYAALPAIGNVDGDVRLTLDTRVAYHWDNTNVIWKPLTGSGSGVKIIGGGTVAHVPPGSALQEENISLSAGGNGVPTLYLYREIVVPSGETWSISSVETEVRNFSGYTGNWTINVVPDDGGGNPDETVILGSHTISATTVSSSFSAVPWVFSSPVVLTTGTYYIGFNNGNHSGMAVQYRAESNKYWESNDGISWGSGGPETIGFALYLEVADSLTFSSNLYLEIKGLDYTDNTIPTTESPIVFPNNYDVAYVIPNLTAGGPALTVTVASLASVPANAIVIARREGTAIIVGSSSTRLLENQTSELYAQASNQTLDFIGASSTADNSPTYASQNYITNGDSLKVAAETLDAELYTHSTTTSGVHGVSGAVVGTTDTQTLTNKTLGFLRQAVTTDNTTTGSTATLTAFTTGIVRVTNVSLNSLAGIPSGVSGQRLTIENKTGASFIILNDDAGASAANRILTGTSSQISIPNNSTFDFTYDSVDSKWMLTGGAGAGAGIASVAAITLGATSVVVTLPQAMLDTSYVIVSQLANLTDAAPQFQPVVITAKTTTTFTATWNSPTDTANYVLAYTTSGVASSTIINGRVNLLADIVVGSASDVSNGFADYSSLQSAINAAVVGQKIRVKSNLTIVENVTVNKRVMIEGNGYGTYINGSVTVTGTDYCSIKDFRCNSFTLDGTSDGNNAYGMFFGAAPTDNGIGNSISGVII